MDYSVNKLVKLITHYSQCYYEGHPEISDSEFDKLVDKLREVDPTNSILSTTGWGYKAKDNVIFHECRPILGIDTKFRSYEEAPEVFRKSVCVITPKLDGGSVIVYYKNGKLDKAISRGDGYKGVDITHTISQLNSVPKVLFKNIDIVIRGEILIPVNNSMDIVNVRNMAVGFSQRINYTMSDVEKDEVLFIPYCILNKSTAPTDRFNELMELGFINIPFITIDLATFRDSMVEMRNILTKVIVNDKFYEVPIDGYVIDLANSKSELVPYKGSIETYLSYLVAWKIDTEERETTVNNIDWSTSSMSKYTPVLEIEPVEIDGTTISRVTANSIEWLMSMKCGIGSRITITKSGGVIPKVVTVLLKSEDYNVPKICRDCGSELEVVGAHLFCTNNTCMGQDRAILWNYFYRYRPKYGADALFISFLNAIDCRDVDVTLFIEYMTSTFNTSNSKYDIFNIVKSYDLTDHMSKLLVDFIYNVINAKPTYYDIFNIANIFGLGETQALAIDKEMNTDKMFILFNGLRSDALYTTIDLLPINNLARDNLVKFICNIETATKLMTMFNDEIGHKVIELPKVSSDLPKVCLTNLGGSPLTKSEIGERLSNKYQFVDYVDKSVRYVVYCKTGSSKMKKAEELGIEVLDVKSFLDKEGISYE